MLVYQRVYIYTYICLVCLVYALFTPRDRPRCVSTCPAVSLVQADDVLRIGDHCLICTKVSCQAYKSKYDYTNTD